MPEDFGTPSAQDATAMHEKTVREAGEYAAELDKAVKEDILNRPLGSVKVSPEQRREEYALMRDNPEHLAQFFTDQNATVEQMIQYGKEMESKR
ncbi:hypothetical protein LCGC14_1522640 [marine sediment metagenome]|uniref:Uncharacterized protein n=1 Tax=marine sediment metagenome TaxID=412755 RepID=A0A0F9IYF5_9ZZZZ